MIQILGHGGFFKTREVRAKIYSCAVSNPGFGDGENAGEGGTGCRAPRRVHGEKSQRQRIARRLSSTTRYSPGRRSASHPIRPMSPALTPSWSATQRARNRTGCRQAFEVVDSPDRLRQLDRRSRAPSRSRNLNAMYRAEELQPLARQGVGNVSTRPQAGFCLCSLIADVSAFTSGILELLC